MTAEALQSFFQAYANGNISAAPPLEDATPCFRSVTPRASPVVDPEARKPELAEVIKTGQRFSAPWKSAWVLYCQTHGESVYDPMKHTKDYLQSFLDFLGSHGAHALGGDDDSWQSARNASAPSAKRAKVEVATAHVVPPLVAAYQPPQTQLFEEEAYGEADEQAVLVARVKGLQRSDAERRKQWVEFCETHGQGVKDPMRHDVALLKAFLQLTGAE